MIIDYSQVAGHPYNLLMDNMLWVITGVMIIGVILVLVSFPSAVRGNTSPARLWGRIITVIGVVLITVFPLLMTTVGLSLISSVTGGENTTVAEYITSELQVPYLTDQQVSDIRSGEDIVTVNSSGLCDDKPVRVIGDGDTVSVIKCMAVDSNP